jgi:hypothetical protein
MSTIRNINAAQITPLPSGRIGSLVTSQRSGAVASHGGDLLTHALGVPKQAQGLPSVCEVKVLLTFC